MPKSKIFWFDEAVKRIATELAAWMRHRDVSPESMGLTLGFCANTWFRRMRDPSNFTLAEVWKACNKLKIPKEEAVSLLTAGLESMKK